MKTWDHPSTTEDHHGTTSTFPPCTIAGTPPPPQGCPTTTTEQATTTTSAGGASTTTVGVPRETSTTASVSVPGGAARPQGQLPATGGVGSLLLLGACLAAAGAAFVARGRRSQA